jgi:hypothetical protein
VIRCALGLEPDDVASALRGEAGREGRSLAPDHLATCASCRGARRLLEDIRTTWHDANVEDDRSRAVFREQRLAHGVRPYRPLIPWWGYAALAGAILAILVARRWQSFAPPAPSEGRAPVFVRDIALPASRPALPMPAEAWIEVLASAGTIDPPVAAGERLPRSVHLSPGASLSLAWSLSLSDEAVVRGPADLSLVGESSSIVLVLSRADGETAAREERRVKMGESLGLVAAPHGMDAPGGTLLPHQRLDPAKEFARGMALLSAGDRRAAQRSFRTVADTRSAPASLRRRALFRTAEIELARGEVVRARAELATLVTDANLSLAADAAFLLARAASAPAERAEVWGRYLARHPGTPYREDAMLERAGALITAGRTDEAADLLAQLSTEATLTNLQQVRLVSLQSQIH